MLKYYITLFHRICHTCKFLTYVIQLFILLNNKLKLQITLNSFQHRRQHQQRQTKRVVLTNVCTFCDRDPRWAPPLGMRLRNFYTSALRACAVHSLVTVTFQHIIYKLRYSFI